MVNGYHMLNHPCLKNLLFTVGADDEMKNRLPIQNDKRALGSKIENKQGIPTSFFVQFILLMSSNYFTACFSRRSKLRNQLKCKIEKYSQRLE